jgi:hypothetical protein
MREMNVGFPRRNVIGREVELAPMFLGPAVTWEDM